MRVTLFNLIALLLLLPGCSKTAYEIPSGVQPVALPELSKLDEIAKGKITFACTSLIQRRVYMIRSVNIRSRRQLPNILYEASGETRMPE